MSDGYFSEQNRDYAVILSGLQEHSRDILFNGCDESPRAVRVNTGRPKSAVRRKTRPSGGAILLVDDDEVLSGLVREILEAAGYKVFAALSGWEALEIYKQCRDDIDLVLLDMIMPGIGGTATFRELKAINQTVSVIIISGYSRSDEVHELLAQGCEGYLQKPFQIPELFSAIRRAMRRGAKKRA